MSKIKNYLVRFCSKPKQGVQLQARQLTLVKQDGGAILFLGAEERTGRFFQVIRGGGSSFWLPKTERTCDFVINSIFLMFQNVLICILWG